MRYLNSFIITTFIYTVLLASFLYTKPFDNLTKQVKEKNEKTISLNYVQITKKNPPKIEKEAKKQIVKKELKKEVKKRVVQKKVFKKSVKKPKTIVKKQVIKKPIKKEIKKENKKIVKKKIIKKELKTAKKAKVKNIPKKKKFLVKKVSYKKKFLKENLKVIVSHIKKNIKYPRIARKLHIEGEVLVQFILLESGKIKDIQSIKGHKLLSKASLKAINKASKLFPKVEEDITIKVPLMYSLK